MGPRRTTVGQVFSGEGSGFCLLLWMPPPSPEHAMHTLSAMLHAVGWWRMELGRWLLSGTGPWSTYSKTPIEC